MTNTTNTAKAERAAVRKAFVEKTAHQVVTHLTMSSEWTVDGREATHVETGVKFTIDVTAQYQSGGGWMQTANGKFNVRLDAGHVTGYTAAESRVGVVAKEGWDASVKIFELIEKGNCLARQIKAARARDEAARAREADLSETARRLRYVTVNYGRGRSRACLDVNVHNVTPAQAERLSAAIAAIMNPVG